MGLGDSGGFRAVKGKRGEEGQSGEGMVKVFTHAWGILGIYLVLLVVNRVFGVAWRSICL